MNLLLVRHAESLGNASGGDYSVANADSLSPRGLKQAEALAVSLQSRTIDQVLVSPLHRAQQTIAPYLAATGRTAEIWPELAEACWHELREPPAKAWDAQPANLSESLRSHFFFRGGEAIRPVHPESFGTGLRRVYDALERLEENFGGSGQTILIVSHGHFIREMINRMLRLPDPQRFPHDNCGMTQMNFRTAWQMQRCNQSP